MVKNNADLELQDADYLLVLPDNDEARLIAADAAWDKGVVMATAATSATSGYAVVQQPDRACLRCAAHLEQPPNVSDQRESCSAVVEDAIIPTNMVVAGVAVSELREAMSGRPATNLRFHGTNVVGNCLARKASPQHCMHGHGVGHARLLAGSHVIFIKHEEQFMSELPCYESAADTRGPACVALPGPCALARGPRWRDVLEPPLEVAFTRQWHGRNRRVCR